jgi:hypothetical protein
LRRFIRYFSRRFAHRVKAACAGFLYMIRLMSLILSNSSRQNAARGAAGHQRHFPGTPDAPVVKASLFWKAAVAAERQNIALRPRMLIVQSGVGD